jgi:signal transduction histidine kinase
MSLNFLLKTNDKTIHVLRYVIIPSISLSVIALISTNQNLWNTSAIDHYYIELFGTMLAGVLALYYISRSHNLNDKFSLFIGIGFLVNALIDLLHVIVSLFNMDDNLFLKYFIPQTWYTGRLFLSAMLAIAIVKYTSLSSIVSKTKQKQQITTGGTDTSNNNHQNKDNKLPKSLLFYLIILVIYSSIIATSSLFVVFPFSVIDDILIHRPYELFPLALFLISLYYFYKNGIYKNKDIFYTSLAVSIVFDIFGQIIMSYSVHHFDTAHSIAHVLKDTGYFINITGLALSSIQYNRELRESNTRLRESNSLLNQQYKKVKESEKMKEEFINIAAHELRTPIQPILGLTTLMYSKIKDKEQHEILEIIIRNAERLKLLTENVLDVTKIESQSLMLEKEKLNLNVLISEILKEYVNREVKHQMVNIDYDFKFITDVIVEADRDRLSQVIHNLVDNALKFTTIAVYNDNQTIFVIVEKKKQDNEKEGKEKEQAVVSIKDTGPGIPKEILPKLFSKFTTGNSSSGTGLGLYISKSIVEAHGGKIWADNIDDKGATFSFTLPIINEKMS